MGGPDCVYKKYRTREDQNSPSTPLFRGVTNATSAKNQLRRKNQRARENAEIGRMESGRAHRARSSSCAPRSQQQPRTVPSTARQLAARRSISPRTRMRKTARICMVTQMSPTSQRSLRSRRHPAKFAQASACAAMHVCRITDRVAERRVGVRLRVHSLVAAHSFCVSC